MKVSQLFRMSVQSCVLSFVLAFGLVVSGCSSLGLDSGKGGGDVAAPVLPAEQLYNEGLALSQSGRHSSAVKKFEQIEKDHPYSDLTEKALVLATYSYFQNKLYEDAALTAERYLSLYPAGEQADYVHFMMAESYTQLIPDIARDQGQTYKAAVAWESLIARFPDSKYADEAQKKLIFARDQLAGKEMQVGRYYLKKRDYLASINRFKLVVENYSKTRHVEEALARLTEAYLSLGVVHEAQAAASVLGHNYPDSQWYRDSYKLLQSGGLEPRENKKSWMYRALRPLVS